MHLGPMVDAVFHILLTSYRSYFDLRWNSGLQLVCNELFFQSKDVSKIPQGFFKNCQRYLFNDFVLIIMELIKDFREQGETLKNENISFENFLLYLKSENITEIPNVWKKFVTCEGLGPILTYLAKQKGDSDLLETSYKLNMRLSEAANAPKYESWYILRGFLHKYVYSTKLSEVINYNVTKTFAKNNDEANKPIDELVELVNGETKKDTKTHAETSMIYNSRYKHVFNFCEYLRNRLSGIEKKHYQAWKINGDIFSFHEKGVFREILKKSNVIKNLEGKVLNLDNNQRIDFWNYF